MKLLSAVLMSLCAVNAFAADVCAKKPTTLTVKPGPDGLATFELAADQRAVIAELKATVCVASFQPARDSKEGAVGPTADLVLHVDGRDTSFNTGAGLTFAGAWAASASVLQEGQRARVQVMRAVTACTTSGRFGSQHECIRSVCRSDHASTECRAWAKALKGDKTPPTFAIHLRSGRLQKPGSAEASQPSIALSAHGSDEHFIKSVEWRLAGKAVTTCAPQHDAELCTAEVGVDQLPKDLSVVLTDEAGNRTTQSIPLKLKALTFSGAMRMNQGAHKEWFVKLSSPECGDFEESLGSNDATEAPGGCSGAKACDVSGDFLVLALPDSPTLTGQRCFLKTLKSAH